MKSLLILSFLALPALCAAVPPLSADRPAVVAAQPAASADIFDVSLYGNYPDVNAISLNKDMLRLAAATGALFKMKGLDATILEDLDKVRLYSSRRDDFRERMTADIETLRGNFDYEEGSMTASAKAQTKVNLFSHVEGEYITELLVFVDNEDVAIVGQITGQMSPEDVAQIVKAVAEK
ncbi:MAG: DUF4252 domain-containing protein [Bacteroidales bacterium]|nr:DUF4252 domain-containing protein [Bacteroidales bacterium]